jgi:hypothetical protein
MIAAIALFLGPLDVVLLDRHRVRDAALPNAVERGGEVADAGGLWVVRVVGEDLEDPAADDLVAPRHGGVQVGVRRGDDPQVGVEHQVKTRRSLE